MEVSKLSKEKEIKFSEKNIKKILQIKKGEYLLEIRNNAIATTYSQIDALDITNWSLEQLGFIVGNLKKVGYNKAKVIDIIESNKVEDNEQL